LIRITPENGTALSSSRSSFDLCKGSPQRPPLQRREGFYGSKADMP